MRSTWANYDIIKLHRFQCHWRNCQFKNPKVSQIYFCSFAGKSRNHLFYIFFDQLFLNLSRSSCMRQDNFSVFLASFIKWTKNFKEEKIQGSLTAEYNKKPLILNVCICVGSALQWSLLAKTRCLAFELFKFILSLLLFLFCSCPGYLLMFVECYL